MTGWGGWLTWNLAKSLNLTIRTNAQSSIRPGKWKAQTSLGFCDTNGSPNLGQTTRPSDSQQQKKRTCRIVECAVHWVKLKEKRKER